MASIRLKRGPFDPEKIIPTKRIIINKYLTQILKFIVK